MKTNKFLFGAVVLTVTAQTVNAEDLFMTLGTIMSTVGV